MTDSRPIPKMFYDQAFTLCYYSELLWQKSMVEGNGGNLSLKLDNNLFLATPTLHSKNGLNEKDLVIVDSLGNQLYGDNRVTSELFAHLAIYKNNPDIGGIIHSHPPYTCSYAFSTNIPSVPMSAESVIWMEDLILAPYNMPGSQEFFDQIESLSRGRYVIALQNHGLIAWGKDLKEAFWRTEVVEAHCKISHIIESRGASPRHFTYKQMTQLSDLRNRFLKE